MVRFLEVGKRCRGLSSSLYFGPKYKSLEKPPVRLPPMSPSVLRSTGWHPRPLEFSQQGNVIRGLLLLVWTLSKSRVECCQSAVLQPWRFPLAHRSVTSRNPRGPTINQALQAFDWRQLHMSPHAKVRAQLSPRRKKFTFTL
jgi:hypothetical protein